MMLRQAPLIGLLLLGGCVTKQLDSGLDFLVGQNVQVAASRLGYPDEQREFQGDKLFIWHRSGSIVMPQTTTTSISGSVGLTPVWGSSSTTSYVDQSVSCTIQLATNQAGIITSWHWEGNMTACWRFGRALAH